MAFEGVDVADFGIRGMDLAYALADYDVVVFLDATPRGGAPGTLYLIEPDLDGLPLDVDAHAMHPVTVLALAKTLGGELPRTLVLGCEPAGVEEFTELSDAGAGGAGRGREVACGSAAKGAGMKNAIIVIGGSVAALARGARCCPRSSGT